MRCLYYVRVIGSDGKYTGKIYETKTCEFTTGLDELTDWMEVPTDRPDSKPKEKLEVPVAQRVAKLLSGHEVYRLTCVSATGFHQQGIGTGQAPAYHPSPPCRH